MMLSDNRYALEPRLGNERELGGAQIDWRVGRRSIDATDRATPSSSTRLMDKVLRVRSPLFPDYSEVRHLLRIWDGVPKANVSSMITSINNQRGTPQNPVDWSEPDVWIPERLKGTDAQLAKRVWEESDRTVNPRHVYGTYLLVNNHQLLTPDGEGVYRLTNDGNEFLANDAKVISRIDDLEGVIMLLSMIAGRDRARRSDLMPEWKQFLAENSTFGTDSTANDTFRRRISNLVDRGLLERDGVYFSLTAEGIEYAKGLPQKDVSERRVVGDAVSAYNRGQRDLLRERLSVMHPYAFEQLVRDLLSEMGYEDVQVTKESGDRGVDVVATVQFGITTITEVVQVKRHQANIQRPTLDQLRGALPYHKAIRGTLITLGRFSPGCVDAALYPGAAPIGLIDGDKLLDLLIEHGVGVKRRTIELYDLDDSVFSTTETRNVDFNFSRESEH